MTETNLKSNSSSRDTAAAADLRDKGYHIARDVLSAEDIRLLRTAVEAHFAASGCYRYGGRAESRGFHCVDAVGQALCQPTMIRLLKDCVFPEQPLLTGECFIAANTMAGWHKDITLDMGLGSGIYSDPAFRVYKAGVYLQDQPASAAEAFKVRPGSHRRTNGRALPAESLAVRAGDVVIFDVRIDHAARLPTLGEKLLRRGFAVLGRCLRRDPEELFSRARTRFARRRRTRGNRLGIFMTFGPAAPCVRVFEKALGIVYDEQGRLAPEIGSALAANGIAILQRGQILLG